MIIATSVVTGFKKSITQKMSGVASHITISNLDNNSSFETQPLVKDVGFMNTVLQTSHVKHIQPYALKHAIIKTRNEIQGIFIKGIDKGFNWDAFSAHMLQGERIDPSDSTGNRKVMVTKALAQALGLKLGDTLFTYYLSQPRRVLSDLVMKDHSSMVFYSMIPEEQLDMGIELTFTTSNKDVFWFYNRIQNDSLTLVAPRAIKLKVAGIFETGIYELDRQLVMGNISLVQEM